MLVNPTVIGFMRTLKEVNVDFLAYGSHVFHFDDRDTFEMYFSDLMVELRGPYQMELCEKLASVCSVMGMKPGEIRYSLPSAQIASYARNIINHSPLDADSTFKLIILDRSVDMVSPLIHDFSYLAMLNDLLDADIDKDLFQQKYTTVDGEEKERSVVLDETDPVLLQLRHKYISDSVEWLVEAVKTFSKINQVPKAESDDLSHISAMMRQLPKSQELGAKYSVHLELAQMVMKEFRERNLDPLATLQQDVATGVDSSSKTCSISESIERAKTLLMDHSFKRNDIFRTILVMIACGRFKPSQIDDLLSGGLFDDVEMEAIVNIRKLLVSGGHAASSSSSSIFTGLSKKNRKKQTDVPSSFMWSRWTPLLKNIIDECVMNKLDENEYPRMSLAAASEYTSTASSSSSSYSNPVLGKMGSTNYRVPSTPKSKASNHILVFIVGGITYSEIRAIHELMHVNRKLRIILGSTHIIIPNEFVKDMSY